METRLTLLACAPCILRASGALGAALLVLAGCATTRDEHSRRDYLCTDTTQLSVVRRSEIATVEHQGSVYRLTHKPFSLGERYTSANATLIVDGHSAVFVTEDSASPQRCYLDAGATRDQPRSASFRRLA